MGVNDFKFVLRKISHLILPQEINDDYTFQEINDAITFKRQGFKVVCSAHHYSTEFLNPCNNGVFYKQLKMLVETLHQSYMQILCSLKKMLDENFFWMKFHPTGFFSFLNFYKILQTLKISKQSSISSNMGKFR